jgi:hypothetical protein
MPEKITESIFNSKDNLHKFYPSYDGVDYFDLERKHFLYGRINRKGDAVYLQASDGSPTGANLEQIYTGKENTEFAVDFVTEAFTEMRRYIQKMAHAGHINKNSPYNSFIKVHKAWRMGDLDHSYYKYINKLYVDFVENYLSVEHRAFEIKDFGGFVHSFMNYIGPIARYFPLTKTGYILSYHCSPFISGLMIEVARERHGTENNKNILKYANDPNYEFFVKTARKFGFMVDKNAPWRLVYNVASNVKYMQNYGVDFDNIFDFYYDKAHLSEVENLKNYMYALYNTFYSQFAIMKKPKYNLSSHPDAICDKIVGYQYEERKGPPDFTSRLLHDEYWLKIVLKMRLLESNVAHDKEKFTRMMKNIVRVYRMFGINYASDQINNLTKGLVRTKFLREGKFWYGDPQYVYEMRKIQSNEKITRPDQVDYELTSALNKG